MVSAYDYLVLRDDPVLYIPMSDSSGTTAEALVGSDGTYTGSPTLGITGPLAGMSAAGLAGSLTGTITGTSATQPQTYEWWMKPKNTVNTAAFGTQLSLPNSDVIVLGGFTGVLANEVITIRDGSGSEYQGVRGVSVSAHTWTHVAIVRPNEIENSWGFYLNGDLVGTKVVSGTVEGLSPGAFTFNISRHDAICAFAVYDYALPPHRIAEHAAAGGEGILIPWGDEWPYTYGSLTVAPGFESPSYDASSWDTGHLPAGKGSCGLGYYNTLWPASSPGAGNPADDGFCIRRVVTGPWTDVRARWFVDDNITIYFDGTAVYNAAGTGSSNGTTELTAALPDLGSGEHVVAVRVRDHNGNCAFIDIQFAGTGPDPSTSAPTVGFIGIT